MVSFEAKPLLHLTVDEWEAYLAGDPSPDGVRLTLRKKSSSAPGMTWDEALEVALCHGWIDGMAKRLDDDYVLQSFTPRRRNSSWSQVNVAHVERLTREGRMRPAGLAEVERAKADGRWEAAYRQRGSQPPPDLRAALEANPAAAAFVEGLTAQERFQIHFRLSRIRTPATRAARIAEIVERAARGERPYR
jgi:uncharacterized protein YdeI (YjbR/CyaY-like superfamily)